ncbi:MAG: hypothetical protein SOH81_10140 [Acetobacter sp.]|jgi:hypothetical protein
MIIHGKPTIVSPFPEPGMSVPENSLSFYTETPYLIDIRGKGQTMSDDEVIVGYLVQREIDEDEFEFWNPETESWGDDPNDAKLYEDVGEAESDAETLQADNSAEVSVAVVIEDDEEEDDGEEEEEEEEEEETK